MREPEILESINRYLKTKYAAFRTSGEPGSQGHFAIYTTAPPPLIELRRVGAAFDVRPNGRFDRKALPKEARLSERRSKNNQAGMNRLMGKQPEPTG